MAKTIDQLQAEIEKKEAQLSQERHKEQRLKNRLKYYEKGERGKRTHRLCNLGGTVESLAPEVKELTRTEMCELRPGEPDRPCIIPAIAGRTAHPRRAGIPLETARQPDTPGEQVVPPQPEPGREPH